MNTEIIYKERLIAKCEELEEENERLKQEFAERVESCPMTCETLKEVP